MNRSTSIFTFEQTGSLPEINHSYPRRRVSLSVVPSPTTPKAPAPHSRFRSRTMSSHRQHTHSSKPPTSRSKKIIITILILLALFLLGTVIVLSSVKYYLNIPTYAYLTEDEVAWRRSDAISQLSYEPEDSSRIHPRQEWEDVSEKLDPDKGVMGADTIAEVWEELEEVEGAEEGHDEAVGIEEEESLAGDGHVWDVDGQGTGGYWMRKDWDGTVQNSDSWERLFNVSAG